MDLDKTLVVFDSPSPPSPLLMEVPHGWDPRAVPCLVSTGGLSGGSREGAWCLISPAGFILPFRAPPEAERAKYAHGCLVWLEPCGSPCLAPHLHHTIQTYPQHHSGGTQNYIRSIQLYSPCLSSPHFKWCYYLPQWAVMINVWTSLTCFAKERCCMLSDLSVLIC